MTHLTEVLEGYCDPDVKRHAVNAIGENGLTARVFVLGYYDGALRTLLRPRTYLLGIRHCHDTFWPVLQMCRATWLTEFMRVMDRARTSSAGGRENLTIALLHERFQSDHTVPADRRLDEQRRFDALDAEYRLHDMWLFRCRQWFHLDLAQSLQPPSSGGPSIHQLTRLVVDWYGAVGSCVYGGDPVYVTRAHRRGRQFAMEFRRMMLAALRQRKGRSAPDA